MMKKLTSVVLALMLALSLAAAAQAAEDGIVVGWLMKNTTNVFETYINKGGLEYLDKAKADGTIKDYITFDGNTDPSTQINQASDLINLGVDVAILQPAEADGSAPALQALVEAGIPVVVVNARTSNTAELAAAYVGSNDVNAGEIMGQYVLDTLGETGAYGHLQGAIGNSAAIQRTEGVHNIMDKATGWKMLDEQTAEWQGDKASKFTQDWIALYGEELKAIICDNDDMSVASKIACIEANRADIVVIGVDAIDSALQMVKSGELDATVFQDGVGQGAGAAQAAVEVAQGKTVEKETWIPFQLVTKDNVDQFIK
ncbi:substrate-binding domain-containing protein [Bacillota bacterium Meth-B3]|nr:substrate-binding domain-containing protein [Christensenellaceae bacterium]MEA5066779.1 substrate-binding domain-containing protein [Eubacteriales bacterium]MEA5067811.1 substrate-binding domain-containing protein [Christensenellaceae bacterium]